MIVGNTPEGLPIYDGDVEPRVCGTLPPPTGFMMAGVGVGELIPQSDWVQFDYREQNPPINILDQDGRGACVGHASASALEWARWLAGMTHVDLSPWFIYSILCGGWDRGASISEALDLVTKTGTCPFDQVPYKSINPNAISAEAHRDAPNFRIELGGATPTFEMMMSETQLGRVGNFSIGVGGGFNRLDSDGVPPSTGNLNHSTMFGIGAKKAKNGEWLIICQNSWAKTWGDNGYFCIRKSSIYRGNDAWSIAAPVDKPDDPTNPPAAS